MKFPFAPSDARRGSPPILLFWLALLVVLPLVFGATHQSWAQAGGPIVRSIEVQYAGPATVSRERILANMRTTVGQPFNQTAVEDDIRNLYGTGQITNVRIFSQPLADGVKVIVVVQTRSIIKEIVINGAHKLKARSLKHRLTSKVGAILNEETVEEDRQKIISAYQDHGYPDVDVQDNISYNEQAGNATITFTVNEGTKSSLHAVRFIGNDHIKAAALRHEMKGTRGKDIFSFLDKSGRLDQSKLQEDLQAVREYYQNKGYIDVEIVETRTEKTPKGDTILIVVIKEGQQYHVSKLSFEGNKVFTEAEIRRFLKMKEGSLYTPKGLKDDVKVIEDYYGSRGYVDMHVEPEALPTGAGLVALTYKVDEGNSSTIEHINIEGNTVSKDKVIRREMAVAPGEIDNTVLVDTSKKRLENLGYFSKVDINQTDTLVPGRKDLDVLVEEKKTGSLSFGAGFSSVDSLLGQVELSQTNFDITNWPEFTGGGEKFRALAQYGLTQKNFEVSLTEPYFLDQQLALGGSIFYHDTNFTSNDYDERDYGADINVRRGLTRFTAVSLDYRVEDIKISQINTSSAVLNQEAGSETRSAVRGGFSFDTRDSVFLTRRGTRVDFSPFIAGGPLGGQTEIYGIDLTGSHYISLPFDTILLFNGEVSTVDTFAGGDRVPVFDRLYLGGANNLRGYGFRKVGPKDFNGNPVGGRSLARATAEYSYPIIDRVRGAFFYDVGYVNQRSWDFSPDQSLHSRGDYPIDPNAISDDPKVPPPNPLRNDLKNTLFGSGLGMDLGIGFRLNLPIGPIRLDYGYPLTNDGFNRSSTGKFSFNVGYQF